MTGVATPVSQDESEARAVLDRIAGFSTDGLSERPVAAVRTAFMETFGPLCLDVPPSVDHVDTVEVATADGAAIAVRLYRPASQAPLPVLLFFHAGGYVMGDLELTDNFCRLAARDAACAVASVGYRLAPEHKFPGPLEDGYAALCWLSEHAAAHGLDAHRIAVAGESSGGTLAIGVARLSGQRGGPAVSKIFLWYPGTGNTGDTESSRAYDGYVIDGPLMRWSIMSYVNGEADLADPLVQPIRADDLGELPPVYLMAAGLDPRRDDNAAYAERLAKAGGDIEYHCVPGTLHGFLFMLKEHPKGLAAANESIAAIRRWAHDRRASG